MQQPLGPCSAFLSLGGGVFVTGLVILCHILVLCDTFGSLRSLGAKDILL